MEPSPAVVTENIKEIFCKAIKLLQFEDEVGKEE